MRRETEERVLTLSLWIISILFAFFLGFAGEDEGATPPHPVRDSGSVLKKWEAPPPPAPAPTPEILPFPERVRVVE